MQCHCTETVGGRDSPKTQFVEAEAHNASPDPLAGMGEIPPHTPRHCSLWEGITARVHCVRPFRPTFLFLPAPMLCDGATWQIYSTETICNYMHYFTSSIHQMGKCLRRVAG